MSVVQRTVEKAMRQHMGVLEQAVERLLAGSRFAMGDLSRVEERVRADGVLWRSAIRHDPSGFFIYAVETTMDGEGFKTRGWIPENGSL